ncbi:TPA: hypothetical protein ACF926_005462 [Escherichia coli]
MSRSDANHLQDGFCCSQNWWKSLWVFCRENAFVVVVFALKKIEQKTGDFAAAFVRVPCIYT